MSALAMTSDLISTALISALTFAERTGATEVAKKAASDAYDALKSLLMRKFGHDSEPALSLAKLEANPSSAGRRQTLAEELTTVHAVNDPELASAAQSLLAVIQSLPGGQQHTQSVTGDYNAVADHGSMAQVNIYAPPPPKKNAPDA